MQFSLGHFARAAFVAAGFHDARAGRQRDRQATLLQCVEEVHEHERGAKENERLRGLIDLAKRGVGGSEVERPGIVRAGCRHEARAGRTESTAHGGEHVDERRARGLLWRRCEAEKGRVRLSPARRFRIRTHNRRAGTNAPDFCGQDVPSEPWQQRSYIDLQRLGAVEMPARALLRRAAGVEDSGALDGREAREFEFLEGGRRHCGDLPPVCERVRWDAPRFAERAIGRDVGKLKREQLAGKRGELSLVSSRAAFDEREQATRIGGKGGRSRHAVLKLVVRYSWR